MHRQPRGKEEAEAGRGAGWAVVAEGEEALVVGWEGVEDGARAGVAEEEGVKGMEAGKMEVVGKGVGMQ